MRCSAVPPPAVPLPRAWPRVTKSAVVHALGLAHWIIVRSRAWCADSPLVRVRLRSELERLRSENAMLVEELRVKDARLARIAPKNRPHYEATDRLAILALRAARGWNVEQVAVRFFVTAVTIASWLGRADEEGPAGLVRIAEPINRFPDFVRAIARRLKTAFPSIGTQRMASLLARAGLRVARTSVRRFLQTVTPPPAQDPSAVAACCNGKDVTRRIVSRAPGHTWLVDMTVMPTSAGLWAPWLPFSLPQCWPFAYWLGIVLDHFSRAVVGFDVYCKEPTAAQICKLLDRAAQKAGRPPKYSISDHGVQFRDDYRAWCELHGVRPRYGAIGKTGSIAIVERFMLTLKSEGLRRILVPYRVGEMLREVAVFVGWYNTGRPHMGLPGATPNEIYDGIRPARDGPRFETRAGYPTCGHQLRAEPGAALELNVGYYEGRRHLPVIELRAAA